MTVEEIIDKHYEEMFKELLDVEGDGLHDFLIEVQIGLDGKTIRRSWQDRNKMLEDK